MSKNVTARNSAELADPLGPRLRDRRQGLGLTLKDVAERTGFSIGFLSQIERGLATPSLVSLTQVCRSLGCEIGEFLSQPRGDQRVTRQNDRPVYALGSNTVSYERLSASFPGNVLRSVIIREPPGFRSEPNSHEGEELYFILEGALTIEINGEQMVLERGDSIHFPSTCSHCTWNHTDGQTTILHTCTMDVFGDGLASVDHNVSLTVSRAAKRRHPPE